MNLFHSNLCRLCANSCDGFVPIFEKTGILDFPEKIKSYLHIEIKYSNDEPRMCNNCHEKIVSWDQYVEQVKKAQDLFMSLAQIKDSCETLDKWSETGLSTTEKNDDVINTGTNAVKISVIKNPVSQSQALETGKLEQKKIKRIKRTQAQSKDSDFSEEDDLPLASQSDSRSGIKKRLKGKQTKRVKPKIKLKIKPLKAHGNKTKSETALNDCVSENVEMMKSDKEEDEEKEAGRREEEEGGGKENEKENSVNGEESDSKDENKNTMAEPLSVFTWECQQCQAPVNNWNALVKHCKEIHACSAAVKCVCGKSLQSRASIIKHQMKHTRGYGYKCEFKNCNKTFPKQQLLDTHSLSHMPKELQPWMCCKCSRRFHTESLLKQHEKVHLPKEEKLIHPCEVCQKKFCSKSAVSAHIRAVHFGERPFVCDQCGHSFTSKGILHEHLTIHSDVCNFHCKDCNKSFKTKYRLKIHQDTHVETRYQCPICTVTLNTRRTLRMHLLVHRDDKAFQCTTCGKAFKRSKDLKNHYNLHTGRRPYTCPFCQRTFTNGSNCRSHKRRMHPEELKMYEAALAAGQQPVIIRTDKLQQEQHQDQQNQQHEKQQLPNDRRNGTEYLEDSNESKSDVSDSKYENRKYSDEEDRSVSLVPNGISYVSQGEAKGRSIVNIDKSKLSTPESMPLNLQRNCNSEEDDDDDDDDDGEEVEEAEEGEAKSQGCVEMNGEENMVNLTQTTFGLQPQIIQYPVNNLYTFQTTGIPAFPGNPFFQQ